MKPILKYHGFSTSGRIAQLSPTIKMIILLEASDFETKCLLSSCKKGQNFAEKRMKNSGWKFHQFFIIKERQILFQMSKICLFTLVTQYVAESSHITFKEA